ncbi:MAG: HD domain-containing protein [Bacteroidales bacterium]|nr:HD domain-containing protein [Candidatus Latescibacterota bacterium]
MNEISGFTYGRKNRRWERSVLEEGGLFLVGGIVRDILLGRAEEKVDADYLVTGIELERLIDILRPHGKIDFVGKSFGVLKFREPGYESVDISLPRNESSTGPRHRDFNVSYDPFLPIEKDLVRRDFTINSMAIDLDGMMLVDPLDGKSDLAAALLRVNRRESFVEDPLRIIRGIQFMARLELSVEKNTAVMMKKHSHRLRNISPERIRMELDKLLLLSERPSSAFIFMHENSILDKILPELEETWGVEQNEFHKYDLFTHSVMACDLAPPELHLRLAALFHDLGKKSTRREYKGKIVFYRHEEDSARSAAAIMRRLKYSNELVDRVEHLIRHHMFFITEEWSDSAIRRFVARVGVENVDDLMVLRMADGKSRGESGEETENEVKYSMRRIEEVIRIDSAFKRSDLNINGKDLIKEIGLAEGRKIGFVLDKLLDSVLDDPAINTRDQLLKIARKLYGDIKKGEFL